MAKSQDELLKRISSLVKQNRELTSEIEHLKSAFKKLTLENEQLKIPVKQMPSEKTGEIRKTREKSSSLKYNMVTVLYGNIHGFDQLLGESDSHDRIDDLDAIFYYFSGIFNKYNISKVKTIGDTFMAAGGIPVKNITNPIQVVMAAMDMQNYLRNLQTKNEGKRKIWDLRLGIHTGPVSASITGKQKISYEIKGDTVNMASRMEGYSQDGKVLISGMTYELVKEIFSCTYYGRMPVKYKSDLDIFVVEGIKPEYSQSGEGLLPNEAFHTKFKLIQFTDLQEIILEKLEEGLPAGMYYHNVKHTIDVVTEAELIGWAEGLSDEEILLLKTAGLFHDTGLITDYDNHEYHSTVLAKKILPGYGYSEVQISRICDIIMATRIPPRPKDILQEIICDSDLDYLGRSDMIPVSNLLYKELKERNKIGTFREWNMLQLKFLKGHQYFTQTARVLREVNKQTQIDRIRKLIEEEEGEQVEQEYHRIIKGD